MIQHFIDRFLFYETVNCLLITLPLRLLLICHLSVYCFLNVFQDHVAEYKMQDPRVDQEIIDSIDRAYFSDDQTFDIIEYLLTVCITYKCIDLHCVYCIC